MHPLKFIFCLQMDLLSDYEHIDARTSKQLAEVLEKYVDGVRLLQMAQTAIPVWPKPEGPFAMPSHSNPVKVAVAEDAAFSPYYSNNLTMLEELGCEAAILFQG